MTYLIDAEGTVRHIVDAQRDFNRHPEETLEQLKALVAD